MVSAFPRLSFAYKFSREELEEAIMKASQEKDSEWVSTASIAKILFPKAKSYLQENYPEVYSKKFEEIGLKSLTSALGNELIELSKLYDHIEKSSYHGKYRIKK